MARDELGGMWSAEFDSFNDTTQLLLRRTYVCDALAPCRAPRPSDARPCAQNQLWDKPQPYHKLLQEMRIAGMLPSSRPPEEQPLLPPSPTTRRELGTQFALLHAAIGAHWAPQSNHHVVCAGAQRRLSVLPSCSARTRGPMCWPAAATLIPV